MTSPPPPPPPPTFKVALVEQLFQSAWAANVTAVADAVGQDSSSDEDEVFDSAPLVTAAAAASRVRKMQPDALKLSAELLRLFVVEALRRAQLEAMVDDSDSVEPLHLEQILAQLMLDF